MTDFSGLEMEAKLKSSSTSGYESSPLQDEYMSASMRKWANENPKTTVGIGLVATAFLAFGGYKLSQSMRAAKSVWTPLAPAVDDLYSGLKGTAGSGSGFALPGPPIAAEFLTAPKPLGKTLLTPLNSGVDDALWTSLKQGTEGARDILK